VVYFNGSAAVEQTCALWCRLTWRGEDSNFWPRFTS